MASGTSEGGVPMRKRMSSILVALGITTSLLALLPGTVRAGVDVSVMGQLFGIDFYVNAELDWTSYDCVETRLYFGGIMKASEDNGCHNSGYSTSSSLYGTVSGEGTFMFQVWSYWNDLSVYEKTWNVPGISLVSSVTPTGGIIGDTFIPNATLQLTSTGPDYYYSVGTFGFDIDGDAILVSATPILCSDTFFSYFDEPPHPEFYYFTVATTISFGTAGDHSVGFSYTDKLTGFKIDGGSSNILITDPFADAIQTLTQRIDSLESELTSVEASVSSLYTNMSEAQVDIAYLKGEVQSIKNDVSSLQSDLSALSSDYDDLQGDVDDMIERLGELETRVSEIEFTLGSIQDDQQTTSDSLGINNILTYLALILSIVALVLVAISKARRKKEAPAPPPTQQQPAQHPPSQQSPPQYPEQPPQEPPQ